jgi:hypothetical protein
MSSPARKFMDTTARQDRMAGLKEVGPAPAVHENELARAKRALWAAEQRFRNILRRNAQARCNSPRLDDAVSEAHQGMVAIRAFYEGN